MSRSGQGLASFVRLLVPVVLAAAPALACAPGVGSNASDQIRITSVSNPRPEMVSGGDVLVRVTPPGGVAAGQVRVTANGGDITGAFAAQRDGSLLGLVTGLHEGGNQIGAEAGGRPAAVLRVVNHPITGPIFSGPHETPFFCMTQNFRIPPGTTAQPTLGPALDADCSAATRVDYVYRSNGTSRRSRRFRA